MFILLFMSLFEVETATLSELRCCIFTVIADVSAGVPGVKPAFMNVVSPMLLTEMALVLMLTVFE